MRRDKKKREGNTLRDNNAKKMMVERQRRVERWEDGKTAIAREQQNDLHNGNTLKLKYNFFLLQLHEMFSVSNIYNITNRTKNITYINNIVINAHTANFVSRK